MVHLPSRGIGRRGAQCTDLAGAHICCCTFVVFHTSNALHPAMCRVPCASLPLNKDPHLVLQLPLLLPLLLRPLF